VSASNLRNIVLQTGKIDPTPYRKRHPEWKVITFTDKFHELLAGAELVVTHFGFTVLEAAIVYKKPVVLHVNPVWTRSVGEEDAAYLARKVNAVLISKLNKETLLSAIKESKNRKVPSLPDGAQNLARIVIELSRRKH